MKNRRIFARILLRIYAIVDPEVQRSKSKLNKHTKVNYQLVHNAWKRHALYWGQQLSAL